MCCRTWSAKEKICASTPLVHMLTWELPKGAPGFPPMLQMASQSGHVGMWAGTPSLWCDTQTKLFKQDGDQTGRQVRTRRTASHIVAEACLTEDIWPGSVCVSGHGSQWSDWKQFPAQMLFDSFDLQLLIKNTEGVCLHARRLSSGFKSLHCTW